MDQAIRDAGLEESDISNERTGIIMGSGGPSTRTIVEAADTTRTKGPKRVGPFAVPKAMSSTASATLATWFKIKGVNYSISSACATSNHCIGNAAEMIQWGKQDMVFAGGCEELDWTLSVLVRRHGGDVVGLQPDAREGLARLRRGSRRLRDRAAAPACWCWKSWSTPRRAARRSTPRSPATARPPTATTWWRPRAKAPMRCMRMALADVKAPVDYINPHATSTPIGDIKEIEAIREVFGAKMPADLGDQVADRPFARRRRRAGGDLFAADDEQRLHLRKRQYREPRSGLRRHADRARAARQCARSAACCRTRSASAAPTPRSCSSGWMRECFSW